MTLNIKTGHIYIYTYIYIYIHVKGIYRKQRYWMLNKDIICPTPGKHSKSIYTKDINDFIRIIKIKIKAHFKITSRKERRDSIHKEFFRIKVGR